MPTVSADFEETSNDAWLALWTKPRAEKAVGRVLAQRLVEYWLPTQRVRRQWSDRWKELDLPLFPSYIFAQISLAAWPTLLRAPGVLTVVKLGQKPAWLNATQMAEVRFAVDRLPELGVEPTVVAGFEPGDRVRVIDGPMAGFVGSVREMRGNRRLLVGFEQIGQAISVAIGSANVEVVGR